LPLHHLCLAQARPAHAGGHISAEDAFIQVKNRSRAVNLATVYRTLDLLVARGLATRADLLDGRVVYATVRHGPHIHLVCRRCGEVISADQALVSPIGKIIQQECNFSVDLQHATLIGMCGKCHEATE
jgi:Fur family ferric uptake transcriptional regulator